MNLDSFLELAKQKECFETLSRPTSSAEIFEYERELGVTFPEQYRRLIQTVGWVGWFGNSIFGVCDSEEDCTVYRTKYERQSLAKYPRSFPPLPKDGNIIGEIFGGGFCFLYSMESSRAGQIAAHAPDDQYQEVQYWDCLEDYFDYLINDVENWHPAPER